MGEKGLRVLAFAARLIEDDETQALNDDPMSLTHDLGFVGMVGIIDPLRAEAKGAVSTALRAGIDVRMITGDHAVTAQAIGENLGLGPGAISGPELQALSDEELERRLPAAARVRTGDPGGQAAPREGHAARGADRRDDRGRRQRCRGTQAGRHRRGNGQRQRGHQTGCPHDPHRRQLRHPGARRRARPPGLRQDRLLRAVPDDPAARPGDAVRRSKRVQHQPGRCADPHNGAVSALLRDRARSRHHHRGSGRPRRHEPTSPGPEHPDHQPHGHSDVDPLRRRPVPGRPGSTGRRPGPAQHRQAPAHL